MIRSRARLSYEQVQRALDGAEPLAAPLREPVEALMRLARVLRQRRIAVGALQIESSEVKAMLDPHGAPVALVRREHLESHELVEEFMLLANRCVGEAASVRGSGVLWRVHEPPLQRRVHRVQVGHELTQVGLLATGDQPREAVVVDGSLHLRAVTGAEQLDDVGLGAREGGALLLLGEEPPEDAPLGPVAVLAAGAFRGPGEGLFAASAEAPYDVYGVADRGGLPAEAARFALRLLEEGKSGKSGRWLRYGGKAGIFGVF